MFWNHPFDSPIIHSSLPPPPGVGMEYSIPQKFHQRGRPSTCFSSQNKFLQFYIRVIGLVDGEILLSDVFSAEAGIFGDIMDLIRISAATVKNCFVVFVPST